MAHQGAVVRNLQAAEPDAVPGPEPMNVKPLADARDARRARQPLGHEEVLRIGQFHQQRIAGDQHGVAAEPLQHRQVVRGDRIPVSQPVGGFDHVPAKALRGLHPPETIARGARHRTLVAIPGLERVRHG